MNKFHLISILIGISILTSLSYWFLLPRWAPRFALNHSPHKTVAFKACILNTDDINILEATNTLVKRFDTWETCKHIIKIVNNSDRQTSIICIHYLYAIFTELNKNDQISLTPNVLNSLNDPKHKIWWIRAVRSLGPIKEHIQFLNEFKNSTNSDPTLQSLVNEELQRLNQ